MSGVNQGWSFGKKTGENEKRFTKKHCRLILSYK